MMAAITVAESEETTFSQIKCIDKVPVVSGGTDSSKERNLLQLKLLPGDTEGSSCDSYLKFRIIPNDVQKFNGDCLFMVLAQFLHPNCDPCESLHFHCIIRQIIINFLTREENDLATWKKYSIFLKDNHQSRIKEFRNYAPESPCKIFHTKIQKAYKRYMMKGGNFGTMAELDAAMELFGFRTTLIQENPLEKQFSVYNIGNNQRLHHLYLLFTGHSDNGHFQKLELITDTLEVPVGNYQIDSYCQARSLISLSKLLPTTANQDEVMSFSRNEIKRSFEEDNLNGLLHTTKRMKLDIGSAKAPGDPQQDLNQDIQNTYGLNESEVQNTQSNFLSSCFHNQVAKTEEELKAFRSLSTTGVTTEYSKDTKHPKDSQQNHEYSVVAFHMYLPPWSQTPFQLLQSNICIHIVDKSFLLMDIATPAMPTVKNLILINGNFHIHAGDTYSLKNVTDHGICIKIFHP